MIRYKWLRLCGSAASATEMFLLSAACLFVTLSGISASAQSPDLSPSRPAFGSTFVVAPSFPLSAAPTSVAVGDLTGDGKAGLVFTRKSSGNVTVLVGDGKGGFKVGVDYPAGTQPGNVQLADINGDGRLDVIVTDSATGAVDVLLGNGDGTFGKPVNYQAIANPVAIALGNFRGKGKVDLAVAAPNGLAILLNDGKGHFSAASSFALDRSPLSLTAADFNGDGADDIVVGNQDGTARVLLSDGTGNLHFLPASNVGTGPLSSVVSGDFNHDGKLDLAVTQVNSAAMTVLLGHGDGTFEKGASYSVGNRPASVIVADVNGDSIPDLITVNQAANTFSVLLGNGDGSFQSSVDFAAGNSPLAVAAADFNGDGHADLAIMNYADGTVSVPLGRGDGTFLAARSFKAGLDRKAIAAGDLDGDGKPDLVVTNYCGSDPACAGNGNVAVFLATKGGSYQLGSTYPLGSGPVAVALADLNGDKKLDLLALNRNDKTLTVMLGNGDGTFGQAQLYSLSANPSALFVGDLNGDGKADLAIASDCGLSTCAQPGTIDIWLGHGDGSLAQLASYPVGFSPVSIASGDLHGTGHADLVVANTCGEDSSCKAQGTAILLSGDGKGRFTQTGEINIGLAPSSIAIGTFSGGRQDLVVAQRTSGKVAVLPGDGNGSFGAPVTYAAGAEPASLVVADFYGDGQQDVAVANFKASTVSVLHGTGTGTFQPAVTYPVGAGPQSMVQLSTAKGVAASLVTANGNAGPTPMGSDITFLANPLGATATTVTLTNSPATSVVDAQVTLTATVAGAGATGSMSFTSNGAAITDCNGTLSSVPLVGGIATCVTRSLTVGSPDSLQAAYGGDGTYNFANSNTVSQTVTAAATTTTLASVPASSTVDQSVTFTATIAPSPVPVPATDLVPFLPTATVDFQDSGSTIAGCGAVNVTFNAGTGTATATCTVTSFTTIAHSITAIYSGDANYKTSTSSALPYTVTAADTTTTLTSSTNPSNVDQSVTFNATVTPSLGAVPNGPPMTQTVAFMDGATAIPGCAAQPVIYSAATGTATSSCTTAALTNTNSPHTIKAVYSATDPNYNTSISLPVTQTVNTAATKVTVSTSANPTVDQPVTLTATVATSLGNAITVPISGTVTFTDTVGPITGCTSAVTLTNSTTGVVTCTATALIAGPHPTITALFASTDTNYGPSSGTVSVPVSQAATTTQLAAVPTSTVDQPVTLTATVAPVTGTVTVAFLPAGTVTFKESGNAILGCGTPISVNPAGVATCSATSLSGGTNVSITAVYSGDSNYTTSNTSTTTTVNKAATATALTSSAPSSAVNQLVTFSATVTPTGPVPLTGTVSFTDNGNPLGGCTPVWDAATGKATCATSTLIGGNHSIVATYSGDSNYLTSNNNVTQSVGQTNTTTTLTSSANPSTVDQSVTFTATVAPTSGTVSVAISGTVAFTDNGGAIAACSSPVTVSSGAATCTTSALTATAGTPHAIVAVYSGDSNYGTSTSNTVPQAVNKAPTKITVVPAPSASTSVDQPVTFTATVAPVSGSVAVPFLPAGTVTFTDNGNPIAACNTPVAVTAAGVATCTTSALTATTGTPHAIVAAYSGDSNYLTVTSSASPQTVAKANTNIAVTSAPSASTIVDQAVTFTATVAPVSGSVAVPFLPAGTVTFTDNGNPIAACNTPVPVSATGVATCTTAALTAATHSIVAAYTGDSNYGAITSSAHTQTVAKASTTTALATSGTPSAVNQSVTFTATVASTTGSATVPFGGSVTFTDNGNPTTGCTSPVNVNASTGVAACTATALTGGSHTIVATYSGDSNYNSSNNNLAQVVGTITSSVVSFVSSVNPSAVNEPVTLTATISPSGGSVALAGTVSFTENGVPLADCKVVFVSATGIASCTTSLLTLGTHIITAAYTGDPNYSSSSRPLTQVVNPAVVGIVLTANPPNASAVNTQVTFTATITAPAGTTTLAGSVNFTDNGASITNCSAAAVTLQGSTSTGVATCATNSLTAGSHSIKAAYLNDPNFTANSNTITQTVSKAVTSLNLVSSSPANASTVNQTTPPAFTATITAPAGGLPLTGNVTFTDNGSAISNCPASAPAASGVGTWVAVCSDPALTAAGSPHTIQAAYAGDSNFVGIASNLTQTASKAATSLNLSSSPNPSSFNQAVAFTAAVQFPSGSVAVSGNVTFADNGTAISICTALPVSSNGVATCNISTLSQGTHSITASFANDPNFANASSTLSPVQTVTATATTTVVTASSPSSTVNQSVTFTATVASKAQQTTQFSGNMAFTSNGITIPGCGSVAVTKTAGVATCTTLSLLQGSDSIVATYSQDANFATSNGVVVETVSAAAASSILSSVLAKPVSGSLASTLQNTSIVINPNDYDDAVLLTVTVTPASGPIPLNGKVTFSAKGLSNIPECPTAISVAPSGPPATAVPVTITCTTKALPAGIDTVIATYSGDPNFSSTPATITQYVQDYSLIATTAPPVIITQGFATSAVTASATTTSAIADPFTPQPIALTPATTPPQLLGQNGQISTTGFAGMLNITCAVVPASSTAPKCILPAIATLPVVSSGPEQSMSIVLDATTANPGTYSVTLSGVDPTTGLARQSVPFLIRVRPLSSPLTVISGSTSGNVGSVTFVLPAGVSLSSLQCGLLSGTGIGAPGVTPSKFGVVCGTITPATVGSTTSTSAQTVTVQVPVTTNNAFTTGSLASHTNILAAGLLGIPIFGLIGFLRGRKTFFKLLTILVVCTAAFQVLGCGGSFQQKTVSSQGGTTPPGIYYLQVQGTGSDGNQYQSVLQVNVTL